MDLLNARKRAAAKVVCEKDIQSIFDKTKVAISALIADNKSGNLEDYTSSQIIAVRDSLIASAAVRLARRSKELMRMTIQEVELAEIVNVNGEAMHIIKVNIFISNFCNIVRFILYHLISPWEINYLAISKSIIFLRKLVLKCVANRNPNFYLYAILNVE